MRTVAAFSSFHRGGDDRKTAGQPASTVWIPDDAGPASLSHQITKATLPPEAHVVSARYRPGLGADAQVERASHPAPYGRRHERSVFMLIHSDLHRNEARKPGHARPRRPLGFAYPTEMNNRERVVRRAKDHGVATGMWSILPDSAQPICLASGFR